MSVALRKQKFGKAERYTFAQLKDFIQIPPLLEIQRNSFKDFLEHGIREVLDEFSPIVDYSGKAKLYLLDIVMDKEPKYSQKECKRRSVTYSVPLYVKARFVVEETGQAVEENVFLGDIPYMTDDCTFIINGVERVVVNQIIKSPNYYLLRDKNQDNSTLVGQIIPKRGMYIEVKQGANEVLNIVLDRRNRISLGLFLKCFGYTQEDICKLFGDHRLIKHVLEKEPQQTQDEALLEFARKTRPADVPSAETTRSYLNLWFFSDQYYNLSRVGRYNLNKKLSIAKRITGQVAAENIVTEDGEILVRAGQEIDAETAQKVKSAGINEVWLQLPDKKYLVRGNNRVRLSDVFPCDEKELGILEEVYYPVLKEILKENKSKEKRMQAIKERAKDLMITTLTMDDILASISMYLDVLEGIAKTDKIEHLSNKRIATVGELFFDHFRSGVTKLVSNVRETLQGKELSEVTPRQIVNPKAVNRVLRDFVATSQLSQFMDQVNPLSGITQKRRVSATGPGGIKRERADAEVRDIHYTNYGRICPIETPEGQAIGLVNTLTSYAKVNEYGFLETPYRKVDKETGKVSDKCEYYMADIEDTAYIAQATEPLDEEGRFVNKRIICRHKDYVVDVPARQVDLVDASPRQFISVATSLIPFLNSNEANRALMGANMQRQAVPLLRPESPVVGTGMEEVVAHDCGYCTYAKNAGVVEYVSADEVRVKNKDGQVDIYPLIKFDKTNDETCINQKPYVKKGEKVDYAICHEGSPAILIECKSCRSDLRLDNESQLFRYFHTTKASFGVLTNGIVYKFFTDLEAPNIMDSKPFLEINLREVDKIDLNELVKFTKADFDEKSIRDRADVLKCATAVRNVLMEELSNPSEDFVRLVFKKIETVINDKVKSHLNNALNTTEAKSEEIAAATAQSGNETAQEVVTTQDEIDAHNIIRAILCCDIPVEEIAMRDAKTSCAILYQDNNRKPICRLFFSNPDRKSVMFFDDEGEERVFIQSPADLYSYADRLKRTLKKYCDPRHV